MRFAARGLAAVLAPRVTVGLAAGLATGLAVGVVVRLAVGIVVRLAVACHGYHWPFRGAPRGFRSACPEFAAGVVPWHAVSCIVGCHDIPTTYPGIPWHVVTHRGTTHGIPRQCPRHAAKKQHNASVKYVSPVKASMLQWKIQPIEKSLTHLWIIVRYEQLRFLGDDGIFDTSSRQHKISIPLT